MAKKYKFHKDDIISMSIQDLFSFLCEMSETTRDLVNKNLLATEEDIAQAAHRYFTKRILPTLEQ